jgi:hypothetical protein
VTYVAVLRISDLGLRNRKELLNGSRKQKFTYFLARSFDFGEYACAQDGRARSLTSTIQSPSPNVSIQSGVIMQSSRRSVNIVHHCVSPAPPRRHLDVGYDRSINPNHAMPRGVGR